MANKKKARTAGGKGLKPMRFKLLSRRAAGEALEDYPEGSERLTAEALGLVLFTARTVDEAIERADWDCLADCIEQNKKLVPYANLRRFLVRALRTKKRPRRRPPTEETRARRFEMVHMSRMLEETMSTADALEKTAELCGVKNIRTVQRAREEYPSITTWAKLVAAFKELDLAREAGLLVESKGDTK